MGLDRSNPSDRSMAVANNNLANELVESEKLDPKGAQLMVECAEAALMFWKRCGTWVNEERALYLLALVQNRQGSHQAGLQAAQSALRVIKKNGEEPVDEAFIRLAASVAFIGVSDIESAREQLAHADALVESWSDESLVSWYQNERAKVPLGTEGTKA